MKTFPILLALVLAVFSRASAQVTVEVVLNQEQFLQGESMPVAVKIVNQSGRQIHLGAEANWLVFNVESADGLVVLKNGEVPVAGEFDLESSQQGTRRVDIAPYFTMSHPGRYKVTATVFVKDLSVQATSAPETFDIISGSKLWTQDFGVPATNGAPEMRKYSLMQAAYVRMGMRLYCQLSDAADSRIYRTSLLGQTVSFSVPEAQVDRHSMLHVLWQSDAQGFSYCLVNPVGMVERRETYDDMGTRPRLAVNASGEVLVVGGVRRPKAGEIPVIQSPVATPAPTSAPAPTGK